MLYHVYSELFMYGITIIIDLVNGRFRRKKMEVPIPYLFDLFRAKSGGTSPPYFWLNRLHSTSTSGSWNVMENHHFWWENSLFLWPFSIAMLVYQRVWNFYWYGFVLKSGYPQFQWSRTCFPRLNNHLWVYTISRHTHIAVISRMIYIYTYNDYNEDIYIYIYIMTIYNDCI